MDINVAVSCSVVALLIIVVALVPGPVQKISMLDVGQGDSLLFQDGSVQVLIDGGPGSKVLERLSQEMPWFDRKIDVVVATHFDRDHIEGLRYVLEQYRIGMILLPQYRPQTDLSREFVRMIIQKNIPYRFAWYGQQLVAGTMHFRTMSPIPGSEWERLSKNKTNNASIIMRADIAFSQDARPLSFLLTGDAESGIEHMLVTQVPSQAFDVDVLKVGHHGSKTSTSQELFDRVTPIVSLVSVGADNSYGHPTQEVLTRIARTQLFRTDHTGTISFFLTPKGWRVTCRREMGLPFVQQVCIKN